MTNDKAPPKYWYVIDNPEFFEFQHRVAHYDLTRLPVRAGDTILCLVDKSENEALRAELEKLKEELNEANRLIRAYTS